MSQGDLLEISTAIAREYSEHNPTINKKVLIDEVTDERSNPSKSLLGSLAVAADIITVGGLIYATVSFIHRHYTENRDTPDIEEIHQELVDQQAVSHQEAYKIYKISLSKMKFMV